MTDEPIEAVATTMHGEDFFAYIDDEGDLVLQFDMYDPAYGVIPYTHYFDCMEACRLLQQLSSLVARQLRKDIPEPISPVPVPPVGGTPIAAAA